MKWATNGKKILLVEPDYPTQYPPIGLLKIASMMRHLDKANILPLARGCGLVDGPEPDQIFITSLFTWERKRVHDAIAYYHALFPSSEIVVGGIYASLFKNELEKKFPYIRTPPHSQPRTIWGWADYYMPAYDLLMESPKWKNWDKSIMFMSRGCIRSCPWCIVPKFEGKIHDHSFPVANLVYPGHTGIIMWDNNLLAAPNADRVLRELHEIGLSVDINQGLDARLITEDIAGLLADIRMPLIRLAYDSIFVAAAVERAIDNLRGAGIRPRKIVLYNLYNFAAPTAPTLIDTPESFMGIIRHTLNMGVASYPMRYVPLDATTRNGFISPSWTKRQLDNVADTRGALGRHGALYPSAENIRSINDARTFADFFDRCTDQKGRRYTPEGATA